MKTVNSMLINYKTVKNKNTRFIENISSILFQNLIKEMDIQIFDWAQ